MITYRRATFDDVENIHKKMETLLGKEGVFLDDVILLSTSPG